MRCPLGEKAYFHVLYELPRKRSVDILFIGEGPGRGEDTLGFPFVGPAGDRLREVIKLTNHTNCTFGFTNLVACRPVDRVGGKDRPPAEPEIMACAPRLCGIIDAINPLAVVTLGQVPNAYVPSMLQELAWNGRYYNFFHPSHVERMGGTEWRDYDKYLASFSSMFGAVGGMKRVREQLRRR